jgi:hypothetical protein
LFPEELPVLKRDFEKLLLEAVNEGLSSLGESSKEAIYFHLDKNFNIKKREIPDKIGAFAGAVENIFGFGADFFEIAVMRQLHAKVSQGANWHASKGLTSTEYVTATRQSLLHENKPKKANGMMVQCDEIMAKT